MADKQSFIQLSESIQHISFLKDFPTVNEDERGELEEHLRELASRQESKFDSIIGLIKKCDAYITALQNDGTANVQIEVGTFQDPADRVTLDFTATTIPVSVEDGSTLVNDYYLDQNYPNPFNPSTRINFGLKKAGNVEITVYNILGNKVATLFNGFKSAGSHSVLFNASEFSSGVYFYKIISENFVQTRKMLMLK